MGIHDGHRQRMIERFLKEDLEHFAQHEILELVLFFSIPRQDTNELAHRLINTFGSLRGVLDASYEELLRIKGVGEHTATLLKLLPAVNRAYVRVDEVGAFAGTMEAVASILRPRYLSQQDELSYVLLVDTQSRCLGVELLNRGSVNATEVSIRRLVTLALRYNAAGVILAHNHPTGLATPSPDDVRITNYLLKSLSALNIQLLDHLIFDQRGYSSMLSCGLLNKVGESTW